MSHVSKLKVGQMSPTAIEHAHAKSENVQLLF